MIRRRNWFGLDAGEDAKESSPEVAVFGLPFDGSVSFRGGAAAAPARLREISRTSDPVTRRGVPIPRLRLRDFGDHGSATDGRERAGRDYLEGARQWLEGAPGGAFRILLGGDNSVSIPGIQSFVAEHGPDVGVLWFDAHPDLFELYDGNPDSHACALRRSMDLCGIDPGNVILLATRSFSAEEVRFIRDRKIRVISAADWIAASPQDLAGTIAAQMSGRSAVYLAVDIDGFDASFAPGTGYPMPGGIAPESFFRLLEEVVPRIPLRALDLTEIAPSLDTNDVTAFLGVQVVLEVLGLVGGGGE
jgi:agmatinase